MELKKSKKADLENKRPMFFQIGLIVSLSMALIAFEWSTRDQKEIIAIPLTGGEIPEDVTQVTTQEEKLPPPPAMPEVLIITTDPEIEEYIPVFSSEDKWNIPAYVQFDNNIVDSTDDTPFIKVEEMPKFMGGDLNTFHKYIQSKIIYPEEAVELGLEGRVYVNFVIDKKGKVTDVSILRGVDKILDNAVISEVEASPMWTPGKQRGKPVKVAFSMPVIFKLQK